MENEGMADRQVVQRLQFLIDFFVFQVYCDLIRGKKGRRWIILLVSHTHSLENGMSVLSAVFGQIATETERDREGKIREGTGPDINNVTECGCTEYFVSLRHGHCDSVMVHLIFTIDR